MKKRTFLKGAAATAMATALPSLSNASSYPAKPIRWIVPTAAGGGSDFVVRTVAARLSLQLGQQIIIDNRPGGGTTIGADLVAKSPGDGYTVLTADIGTIVYNTALFSKLPYVPLKDFAPVGMLADFPLALVVQTDSPWASAQDAIKAIRGNPGKFSYASAGVGSPHHIAMEMLKDQAGLDIAHVPYKGAAPALQDLLAGTIPIAVLDLGASTPMLKANKVRPLALFTKDRVVTTPNTPTLIELGLAKTAAPCWTAMMAPASTPAVILEKLSMELASALRHPQVQETLRGFGLSPQPTTIAQFKEVWLSAYEIWPPLIRSKGITID